MPAFAHTPYDGSKQPFSIGLAPLDPATWIEPDDRLADYLGYKARLFAGSRDAVFAAEAGTEASQAEVLDAIVADVLGRQPGTYRRTAAGIAVDSAGLDVPLGGSEPPLLTAARLVAEDLVIMRRTDAGWRLVAAALCFPSSWSLKEKYGRTMEEIHAPVPGYPKMAERMNRIFDSLRVEIPVWRLNWSLYPDDDLHHPEPKQLPRGWFEQPGSDLFVRVERQTLRRMPESGDILFTIKVMVDPVAAFSAHPDGPALAAGLRKQLLALDPDQLAYKSLTNHRDVMADRLATLAS
ncbi:heme-dependent oxidative N-demethylase family protein [Chthonobacter albigriseus]|uniref:heme-dependent oxidative N-demethylase family protein n=1 Tax=Chthonobacter albigriseus TaxID=1683161 RepID=UPI0015EE442E|nr:DUF3445 domain-containing protein [Chthonobacter albigriseus]